MAQETDTEVVAIQKCVRILNKLSDTERRHVIAYIGMRFEPANAGWSKTELVSAQPNE